MKKTVSTLSVVGDDDAAVLPEMSAELQLAFADVAELAREGLMAMSVAVGLRVMNEMMEAEVTDRVGAKHAKLPDRSASRHAAAAGSVVLGGRRVPVSRPRARTTDGTEVRLETYATFSNDDLLTGVVMERMLAGVATRRHRAVGEPVGEEVTAAATATSRSAVSRRFKAATSKALDELMARDLTDLRVAAMMIDGIMATLPPSLEPLHRQSATTSLPTPRSSRPTGSSPPMDESAKGSSGPTPATPETRSRCCAPKASSSTTRAGPCPMAGYRQMTSSRCLAGSTPTTTSPTMPTWRLRELLGL